MQTMRGEEVKAKFEIGDKILIPSFKRHERRITCPDCAGNRFLTVIMGDKTEITIKCENCGPGYEPPSGYIKTFEFEGKIIEATITGLEINSERVRYHVGSPNCYRCFNEDQVTDDYDEATIIVARLEDEHKLAEQSRLQQKVKAHRSWGFSASYHKREMKRHQKDFEYHRQCLDYAKTKIKGENETKKEE